MRNNALSLNLNKSNKSIDFQGFINIKRALICPFMSTIISYLLNK